MVSATRLRNAGAPLTKQIDKRRGTGHNLKLLSTERVSASLTGVAAKAA